MGTKKRQNAVKDPVQSQCLLQSHFNIDYLSAHFLSPMVFLFIPLWSYLFLIQVFKIFFTGIIFIFFKFHPRISRLWNPYFPQTPCCHFSFWHAFSIFSTNFLDLLDFFYKHEINFMVPNNEIHRINSYKINWALVGARHSWYLLWYWFKWRDCLVIDWYLIPLDDMHEFVLYLLLS